MSDTKFYDTVMNQLQDVLKKIDDGEQTTSNYYEAYVWYGCINEKGEYDQEEDEFAQLARQAALKEIVDCTACANTYEILAQVSEHFNDQENMFRYINKAIELNPDKADNYLIRGDFYRKIGKHTEAQADYDKMRELDPERAKRMERHKKNIMMAKIFGFLLVVLTIIYFVISIFWK